MKSSGMKMYMSKTWVVFVCALVCCFLWGSAFPCIKIGYSLFSIGASDSASQIVFAGTRFTLAGSDRQEAAGACQDKSAHGG